MSVLRKKRAVFMLNATSACGLEHWNELAVYSYLVYRAGQSSKSAKVKWIARGLRLDRKTVAKALPALEKHGLVSRADDGTWAANELPEDKRNWFLAVKKPNTSNWPWHKRFAGYWCRITAYLGPTASMTPRESAIFWKLHNWQRSGLTPNKKAWETQTLIPYRTILHELKRLAAKKLIDGKTGQLTLTKEALKYWQDKSEKKLAATVSLREDFMSWWKDRKTEYFESVEDCGAWLDHCERKMLEAGYSQKTILDYSDLLIEYVEGYFCCCERFWFRGFDPLFKRVEKIHANEGYKYPNSFGLLKWMTRSAAKSLLKALGRRELYAWELPSVEE